ncbi:MAG: sulfatase-like hydrolase/transferase, partial [Planctomycetota bacterium]
ARDFIRDSKNSGKPFFAYVATNAPHGPMHAPQHLGDQYLKALQDSGRKPNVSLAHFYGMIANIDDNVGRMRRFLEEEGLTNNTIFIFSTDNGTSSGGGVFNAGMRGRKGSEYDGGHRVPFFVHWPQGGLTGGRDISKITAHVDVVPTLLDLCSLDAPTNVKFDGRSIRPLLEDKGDLTQWPDRILVTDSQRVKDPIKWRKSAVMTDQWRLINGKELFDIDKDPGQQKNVADANPAVVKRLTDFYEAWWAELLPTFANETPIYLGHPAENPARLTAHDWITTGSTPWHQGMIRAGMNGKRTRGFWNVNVHQAGEYEITLRRWPRSVDAKLGDALPAGDDVPGVTALRARPGVAIDIVSASVRIGDQESTIAVKPTDSQAVLRLMLPEGRAQMFATFQTSDGTEYGGYYAYVQRK